MTPHHLHATANAWSLTAARARLTALAAAERAANIAEQLPAATSLRSPTYGTRHGVGDHGDPTGGLILDTRPTRQTTWAELLRRSSSRLSWLARQTTGPVDTAGPAWAILGRIPALLPGTAAVIARHLDDEDRWIRAAVGLGDDLVLLPDVACPHCGVRQIHVRTSAPVGARVIVCQAGVDNHGCVCAGTGCGCGMPMRVEGVRHVWAATVASGGESTRG